MSSETFMMHVREIIYDQNGNRNEDIKVPFTEDNFFRCMTNIRLSIRSICRPGHVITKDDSDEAWLATEEACSLMRQLEYHLHTQFKHSCKVRRVCPNPDCKSIYAIFYEDFLYCPKCGTELVTTRDDRKNTEFITLEKAPKKEKQVKSTTTIRQKKPKDDDITTYQEYSYMRHPDRVEMGTY